MRRCEWTRRSRAQRPDPFATLAHYCIVCTKRRAAMVRDYAQGITSVGCSPFKRAQKLRLLACKGRACAVEKGTRGEEGGGISTPCIHWSVYSTLAKCPNTRRHIGSGSGTVSSVGLADRMVQPPRVACRRFVYLAASSSPIPRLSSAGEAAKKSRAWIAAPSGRFSCLHPITVFNAWLRGVLREDSASKTSYCCTVPCRSSQRWSATDGRRSMYMYNTKRTRTESCVRPLLLALLSLSIAQQKAAKPPTNAFVCAARPTHQLDGGPSSSTGSLPSRRTKRSGRPTRRETHSNGESAKTRWGAPAISSRLAAAHPPRRVRRSSCQTDEDQTKFASGSKHTLPSADASLSSCQTSTTQRLSVADLTAKLRFHLSSTRTPRLV